MGENRKNKALLSKGISLFLKKVGNEHPFAMPDDLTGSNRILFIDSGDIVDLLFVAPVINWFRANYPDIKLVFLVDKKHVGIVKSITKVNKIISYDKKQMKLFKVDYMALSRKLKRQGIDTTILTGRQMSLERYLLAFLSGARIRIGFAHPMAFPFINCEVGFSSDSYVGDGMAHILGSLGLGVNYCRKEISLPANDIAHARQLIHFRKPEKDTLTVGIDPGKSKARHNVIPEIIAYLANNLAGRLKLKFLILTNTREQKFVEKLSNELKGEILDLVPSSRSETITLLSHCDLFLSGNTDLFHFAVALNVPTLGIFTKYDSDKWIPRGASHVRIFKGVKGEKLSLKSFFSKIEEVLATGDTVTM